MAAETVLLPGASSGIGRALAHHFAGDGYDLVLVARRAPALEELARELSMRSRVTARVIAADLTQAAAPQRIFDEVQSAGITVDVVVNNAGVGAQGTVAELTLERQLEMIQLNVASLTALTRLFLPGMLARKRGGVLNVASTAAFQPGPLMAVYYATKAYVLSFTEALAEEVAGSGLRITCLAPGATETEFAATADMTRSRLFAMGGMKVEEVARAGYDGWKRGKPLVIVGATNRMFAFFAQRLAPRRFVRRLIKRMNANPS
jgi:short-subunit dehydrogenase